jgi:hypothetical protein
MAGLPALTGFRKVAIATASLCVLFLLSVSFGFAQETAGATPPDSTDCILTFDAFAFDTSANFEVPFVPDPEIWETVTSVPHPARHEIGGEYPNFFVGLVRETDGSDEVWVRALTDDGAAWQILNRRTMDWEAISPDPEPYIIISRLFEGPDNTVWGLNTPFSNRTIRPPETMPMFSRFNEETRRFELFTDGPERQRWGSSRQVYLGSYNQGGFSFLVAPDGAFWTFRHFDGVYRYDPATNTEVQIAEAGPDDVYLDVEVSHEGVVYYSIPKAEVIDQHRGERKQGDVDIYRIDPETLTVSQVPPPELDWPLHNGMIVDRDGHLWLGTIARQNDDLSWERVGEPSRPFPFYASSDGRLWFLRMNDYSSYQGTGWIDPATGEACWLTTFPALVFEDRSRNLWMVARGVLYKQALGD